MRVVVLLEQIGRGGVASAIRGRCARPLHFVRLVAKSLPRVEGSRYRRTVVGPEGQHGEATVDEQLRELLPALRRCHAAPRNSEARLLLLCQCSSRESS